HRRTRNSWRGPAACKLQGEREVRCTRLYGGLQEVRGSNIGDVLAFRPHRFYQRISRWRSGKVEDHFSLRDTEGILFIQRWHAAFGERREGPLVDHAASGAARVDHHRVETAA